MRRGGRSPCLELFLPFGMIPIEKTASMLGGLFSCLFSSAKPRRSLQLEIFIHWVMEVHETAIGNKVLEVMTFTSRRYSAQSIVVDRKEIYLEKVSSDCSKNSPDRRVFGPGYSCEVSYQVQKALLKLVAVNKVNGFRSIRIWTAPFSCGGETKKMSPNPQPCRRRPQDGQSEDNVKRVFGR